MAELLFAKIFTLVDDWGCFNASIPLVRAKLYPYRLEKSSVDRVTERNVENWLGELSKQEVDCVRLWNDGAQTYGFLPGFSRRSGIGLLDKHNPKTPCPPWLLDEQGRDIRFSTKTVLAYERISTALKTLSTASESPTWKQICGTAKCSKATLAKYLESNGSSHGTDAVHIGTHGTDGTPKNLNPNHNPKPNPKPEVKDSPPSPAKLSPENQKPEFAPEDAWIKAFLESQRLVAFREVELAALLDPEWWNRTSIACNGIDKPFLEREFAKLGNWLVRNKEKRPTRQRIQNWLERAGRPQ